MNDIERYEKLLICFLQFKKLQSELDDKKNKLLNLISVSEIKGKKFNWEADKELFEKIENGEIQELFLNSKEHYPQVYLSSDLEQDEGVHVPDKIQGDVYIIDSILSNLRDIT